MPTAKITGTMLTPGVSLNKRLYTKEQIAKTAERMNARIKDPAGLPISMRTHHDAGDDSLRIVGRVTGIHVNPETGSAEYTAALTTGTDAGRNLWQLIKDRRQPLLDSTSIYGWWLGDVREVDHEGQPVEIGDDLEVDAIDFTGSPGVTGARIRTAGTEQRTGTETAPGRRIVTESITARAAAGDTAAPGVVHELTADGVRCVTCTAEKNKTPYGPKSAVKYADPGYQSDGVARYPIDSKAHTKSAWSYINQAKNASKYTAKQLSAIKSRIKAAAKRFGIQISSDGETMTSKDALTETTAIGGVTEWMGPNSCCGFSISAFNGPLTVSVSAYDGIAPGDLPAIAKAAMDAAIQAVKALDPDEDGDFDVDDAPGSDTDSDMGEGDAKKPSGTAGDLAGDTVSRDDDMENRGYSVTATAEGPVTLSIHGAPDPRQVAAAVARRKNKPAPAAAETIPPDTARAAAPAARQDPPAGPADAPPATTADTAAAAAPDSSATDKKEQNMPDQNAATEETTAPPAINEDALKAFAATLGPVIGTAVEAAVSKALTGRDTAVKTTAANTTEAATPVAGTIELLAAPAGADVAALAEAVKASLDGLPGALAEAIKPLIPAPAAETTAASTTETAPAPAAAVAATPAPDAKDVALQAAKLAIPELLEAFGLPRRKGLVQNTEHRAKTDQTPEELWANRAQMWDQFIPQAPAAVQPTPAALAASSAPAAA